MATTPTVYEVTLKDVPARHAAVVRFQAPASEMSSRMPEAFGAVMSAAGRLGIQCTGPAVATYRKTGNVFDVEAGFYVPTPFTTNGDLQCIELPSVRAAFTTHIGPYEGLMAAYEALHAKAREEGWELDESMWEEYWSDPQSTPPSEWRTDIIWPLQQAA